MSAISIAEKIQKEFEEVQGTDNKGQIGRAHV